MSTKSTIILTNDNEHWYSDCSEPLAENPYRDIITLEFSKRNVRIELNDDEDIVISLVNPDSEIYKLFYELKERLGGY